MLNAVIDLSHHNGRPSFGLCKEAGIVGVIHKATQSSVYADPMYEVNRQKAEAEGLWWGAYHFGVYGSGAAQADHFLSVVQPTKDTLLVLDYEPNHSPASTMTIDQAREFVERIAEKTDRYPGLYSGSLIKEQLGSKPTDEILTQCWLWIAQYGPEVKRLPLNTWKTWTLHQYTDGAVGPPPRSVPGIGYCDRNKFNGDLEGLKRLWGVGVPIKG